MIDRNAFHLLAELAANNNRDWFAAHRGAIRDQVQAPFAAVLEAASARLADADVPLSGGAHTMFRMNRDVRFSADKSPYNAHVSGVLSPSGSKGEGEGLLYLHMDAQGGFLAAGHYNLGAKALGPIRDRIVADPERFKAVLDGLARNGLELSREMTLRAMPRGYEQHAGAWFADQLKLQSLMVRLDLSPEAWIGSDVVDEVTRVGKACADLIQFGSGR